MSSWKNIISSKHKYKKHVQKFPNVAQPNLRTPLLSSRHSEALFGVGKGNSE